MVVVEQQGKPLCRPVNSTPLNYRQRFTIMSVNQVNSIVVLYLFFVCSAAGCRATGRSPLAFNASGSPAPVQNQAAVLNPPVVAPTAQTAVANDAISQQIAAESRALSGGYDDAPNPELAKYASAVDNTDGYSTSMEGASAARSGSFTPSSSGSLSGCSSGCCP